MKTGAQVIWTPPQELHQLTDIAEISEARRTGAEEDNGKSYGTDLTLERDEKR